MAQLPEPPAPLAGAAAKHLAERREDTLLLVQLLLGEGGSA
jgi:hypothetical protein